MICSLALYSGMHPVQHNYQRSWLSYAAGMFGTATEALDFFAHRRTVEDGSPEGVEQPSQERYVHYFETVAGQLKKQLPPPVTLTLKCVRVYRIAAVHRDWR